MSVGDVTIFYDICAWDEEEINLKLFAQGERGSKLRGSVFAGEGYCP